VPIELRHISMVLSFGTWQVPRVTPENGNKIFSARHRAEHQWFYFPEMLPSELLAFKT
jgi:hypothetical protein